MRDGPKTQTGIETEGLCSIENGRLRRDSVTLVIAAWIKFTLLCLEYTCDEMVAAIIVSTGEEITPILAQKPLIRCHTAFSIEQKIKLC